MMKRIKLKDLDYKLGFNYALQRNLLFGDVSDEDLEKAFDVSMEIWKKEIVEKRKFKANGNEED